MVTSKTNPKDIEWNSGKNPIPIEGAQGFAMYMFKSKKLSLSKPSEDIEISLEPFHFELITVSPVAVLTGKSVQFAAIGLANMLNTGGAIQSLSLKGDSVEVGVRGAGEMRVYASIEPRDCKIDGRDVPFEYEERMVIVQVPWTGSGKLSKVEYLF